MNISINDEDFINSKSYMDFIVNNPGEGYLKIRAYAANQAVPISGLSIVVSTKIGNNNVIFFEGSTNESGLIEGITLPAPTPNKDDLVAPISTTYDIEATLLEDNIRRNYKVNIYDGIIVIQNIYILPDMSEGF